jgi:flagellar basal-body rod protein FlgF
VNVSLYQAAAAMNANARWQEVISENLAASSIPGFKKQEINFSALHAGAIQAGDASMRVALPRATVATNFAPGEMKPTGALTDVAIEGRGFFEVQLPNGATAYTRDGEFHVNAQGQLVTKEGYTVLGEGGTIQFDRNNPAPISISPNGDVAQGGEVKGKLKLADFDTKTLRPIAGGYFATTPESVPVAVSATLRQGYLEAANTSSVAEMADLITAMRAFEVNQKIVQMQDDRMGRAITELGNPH